MKHLCSTTQVKINHYFILGVLSLFLLSHMHTLTGDCHFLVYLSKHLEFLRYCHLWVSQWPYYSHLIDEETEA